MDLTTSLRYIFKIHTLRSPEAYDKWATMMFDWLAKGGKLLKELGADIALVNGVVPLRFRPRVAVVHDPLINVSLLQ